jgi:hypothetical protein
MILTCSKMKTTGKKAIGLNIPGGVMSGDFSEKADCSQRMVFSKSSLARLQVAVRLGDAIADEPVLSPVRADLGR